MKKMTSQNNKLLKLSVSELVEVIEEMQLKFDVVDDFLQAKFSKEKKDLLVKYKKTISLSLSLDGEFEFNPEPAYKAIENFRKLKSNPAELAEILLHFVEEGISFTNSYCYEDEYFFDDMRDLFEEALVLLKTNDLLSDFKEQCSKISNQASHLGYGFGDEMKDLFAKCFGK